MANEMKRVRPGERVRIPARGMNRILDATEAVERSGAIAGSTPKGWVQPGGTVFAANASGAFRGLGTPVSITGVGPSGCAEFSLAGASGAAGPYAILLQPIAAGEVGLVAVTGGPWQVDVSGTVAAGDRLLPTEGQPYAEVDDNGPLMALSADADGQSWAVFAAGGGMPRLSLNGGLAADSIDIPSTAKIGSVELTTDANDVAVIDFTTECYEV